MDFQENQGGRIVNTPKTIPLVPRQRKLVQFAVISGMILAFVLSLLQLNLEPFGGWETIQKALSFMGRMINMNFSIWEDVLIAALESISVAVLATIISALCAFFLSFFAAVNVTNKGVAWLIKAVCSAIRAVPTLIWALIFVAFLGFGPFAGVLGLFFHSFAYLVKAYSQSIEEVNPAGLEALRATGASWIQVMVKAVIPTIRTAVISWTALRFEFNLGQSAILGLVGAGGIGHELSIYMRFFEFEKGGFVVLVIFLMSFGVEMLFNKLKLNQDKRLLKHD
jgi:phosphonate transport system permease protein